MTQDPKSKTEELSASIHTLETTRAESLAKERTEVEQLLSAALYWPSGFSGGDGRKVKARAEQVLARVKKQHDFESRLFMLLAERVLGRHAAEQVFNAARVERPDAGVDTCERCGAMVRCNGPYVCSKCSPFSWLTDANTQRAELLAALRKQAELLRVAHLTACPEVLAVLAKYPEAR